MCPRTVCARAHFALRVRLPFGAFAARGLRTPQHLILPALTLATTGAGWYARVDAGGDARDPPVRLHSYRHRKGLARRRVVLKHALRNAVLPIIAMIGLDIGLLMGGVVVVESVFAWPGIGQLAWQAIQVLDIPVIMGTVLITALFIVLGNLLADLVYPLVDPRLRYS